MSDVGSYLSSVIREFDAFHRFDCQIDAGQTMMGNDSYILSRVMLLYNATVNRPSQSLKCDNTRHEFVVAKVRE